MGSIIMMILFVLVGIWLFYQGIWFTLDFFFDIDISDYFEPVGIYVLPILIILLCFICGVGSFIVGVLIWLGKM